MPSRDSCRAARTALLRSWRSTYRTPVTCGEVIWKRLLLCAVRPEAADCGGDATRSRDGSRPQSVLSAGAGSRGRRRRAARRYPGTRGLGRREDPAREPTRVGTPRVEVERTQRGPIGPRHCEDAPVGAERLGRWAGAGSDERVADRVATGDIDEPDRGVISSDRDSRDAPA